MATRSSPLCSGGSRPGACGSGTAATAGRDALWGLYHRRNPCKVCQFTIEPLQTGMVLSLWRKRISFDKKRII